MLVFTFENFSLQNVSEGNTDSVTSYLFTLNLNFNKKNIPIPGVRSHAWHERQVLSFMSKEELLSPYNFELYFVFQLSVGKSSSLTTITVTVFVVII